MVSSKGVRYGFFLTTRYGTKRYAEFLMLSEIKRYEMVLYIVVTLCQVHHILRTQITIYLLVSTDENVFIAKQLTS